MSEKGEKPEESEKADKPEEVEQTDEPSGGEIDADFPVEDKVSLDETAEISIAPRARSFSPVAWLALLLSLASLAGVGWLWVAQRADPPQVASASRDSVDALGRSLGSAEESIAAMRNRMSSLVESESARAAELASLDRELQAQLETMGSLPGRLTNLEGSISSLQGISSGVRDTWLLAEAEYYMQIANAQLQLAGNPHLASLALRLADEKVLQLANPALTNARRALAGELRALEVMNRPDIEGATLTIASLAAVVDSLPLKRQAESASDAETPIDSELSGIDRALASLKGAFSSVVSVRQVDAEQRPFVAPEAEYFLRANLSLQLQAARLALLRGEQAVFEQSIDDAANWLIEYYDNDSTAVQGAIQTIAEIRTSSIVVSPPDISESLRLLRQFNTLSEYGSGASAAPATEPEPEPPEPEPEPESEPEIQTESETGSK
jgi:uroporphyrin-3 C-methyltransferase